MYTAEHLSVVFFNVCFGGVCLLGFGWGFFPLTFTTISVTSKEKSSKKHASHLEQPE